MTSVALGRSAGFGAIVLFATIAILIALDLVTDSRSGVAPAHWVAEALVMALAVGGALLLWRELRSARRLAAQLGGDLAVARVDLERWRSEAHTLLQGLGAAIDRQFERWDLTRAEREVALLLLKGLGQAEIAAARSTTERTVRQQAFAVYRKAGLGSRSELAAFFLEDLLLPAEQRDAPEGGGGLPS